MKRINSLVIVLVMILITAAVFAEVNPIQGAVVESTLQSSQSGTEPPNGQGNAAVTVRQEETDAGITASYNASLRVPVAGLLPRTSDVEWRAGGGGGCRYASSGNASTWWSAPLYLPHGSTLRYFRMYFIDQDEHVLSQAFLTVYDLYGEIEIEWGISTPFGTEQGYVTTSELNHVVDYSLYSYVINWRPNVIGSDMQVCGFRVYYEKPPSALFLPSILNDS